MTSTMTSSLVASLAAVMLLPGTGVAAAQTSTQPARWQPWIGCWSGTPPRFVDLDAEPQQVCVVPSAGTSAVDVVTITGAKVVSREHIDADGQRRTGERDGCQGWESARWSSDLRRVYLQSEYTCSNGSKRASTSLMATATNGDWLDIVGVQSDDRLAVRVLRHRPSPPLSTLPREIASAVARDSRAPAELRTLLPIGDAEIIDASKHLNGAVIEAWLAENRQAFTINAARLKTLADAGVDDRVIDVLVALSYPGVFSIKPSPSTIGELAVTGGGGGPVLLGGGPLLVGGYILDCNQYFYGFSLYGFDGCGSPYPFGGGYYGGGWYDAGGGGGIIVAPVPPPPVHGQVVNGRGYVSGDSGSSGGGVSSAGGSSSGSSGSTGSSGGISSGSSGGDRTAVPR